MNVEFSVEKCSDEVLKSNIWQLQTAISLHTGTVARSGGQGCDGRM